jgi:histone deacetylase 1/2
MDVYRPRRAAPEELAGFHDAAYVAALRDTPPEAFRARAPRLARFGLDDDCPVFPGLFDFCRLYAGASVEGAARLNAGQHERVVNWAGGLHHAKRAEASGFCYINDCVLAILELLKAHARVLYVDIDIHHGDGVEEAFYTTDRVLTLSLHLYRPERFFPGTGALEEVGEGAGRGYSVNVPLLEGCQDAEYLALFKPILARVMEVFQPGAVVLQCGADALSGDRIGALSLTAEGHAEAVAYVHSFGLPTLVLGGGGYTKTNVARAWTLDTAALLGVAPPDALPEHPFSGYYTPERLRYSPPPVFQDLNQRAELERVRAAVLENLRHLRGAPGAGAPLRPPEALLPAVDVEGEEAVHERLKAYVQGHFSGALRRAEEDAQAALGSPRGGW